MKRYLGVDLHRTQVAVCVRQGERVVEVRQWRIEQLPQFVAQLGSEDEIAVEAMGTTAGFYDAVVGRVARVVVVNPHQFKVISQSVKKTDRCDAEHLALYLEKGLLPEVRMKDKPQRELQHLLETRDLLVKQRAGAMQISSPALQSLSETFLSANQTTPRRRQSQSCAGPQAGQDRP